MFSVFKVLQKLGNLHVNLPVKMKTFIFMLIKYNTIFKMLLETSSAEPLAPAPHLALSKI